MSRSTVHPALIALSALSLLLPLAAASATEITGTKWPNAALRDHGNGSSAAPTVRITEPGGPGTASLDLTLTDDIGPVSTPAVLPGVRDMIGGFTDMLPFVLPSPDQKDAGSCLFMATTGAAEWWLARKNFFLSRQPDGPVDLSERFTMNATDWIPGFNESVSNWVTDSIEVFNAAGGAMLNRDYRYTKGWYKQGRKNPRPAERDESTADYGTPFNWIALEEATGSDLVRLPRFSREILFSHPSGNRWAVNSAPGDAVKLIKNALVEHQAPILVTYNHYAIWHSVLVVGFNDTASTRGCKFTNGFPKHMRSRAKSYEEKARATPRSADRGKFLGRARFYERQADEVEKEMKKDGACSRRGMFYVRDSLYPHAGEPLYDYDPGRKGEESPYSARIVLREYAWLERLANHAVQILAD